MHLSFLPYIAADFTIPEIRNDNQYRKACRNFWGLWKSKFETYINQDISYIRFILESKNLTPHLSNSFIILHQRKLNYCSALKKANTNCCIFTSASCFERCLSNLGLFMKFSEAVVSWVTVLLLDVISLNQCFL